MTTQQQEKLHDYLDGLVDVAAVAHLPIGYIRRPDEIAADVVGAAAPNIQEIFNTRAPSFSITDQIVRGLAQGRRILIDCGTEIPKYIERLLDAAANDQVQIATGAVLVIAVDPLYDMTLSVGQSVTSFCDLTK